MGLMDNYILNTENFERCICNGTRMAGMLVLFRVSDKEMNDWCLANYGTNFATTYEILRQIAIERFSDVLINLSMRGNNTAMNIMDRMINGFTEDKTVKIVFDNKMKTETDEDKKNG